MILQEWINANAIETNRGALDQCMFVRDYIGALFGAGMEYWDRKDIVRVISTHRSKSVILPVYDMEREDIGLRLVLRNNFYNWKVSVISQRPLLDLEESLSYFCHTTPPIEPAYTGDELASCYFEGFPKDLIFGYYSASDHMKWSMEIGGVYPLWTALHTIMKSCGVLRKARWHTKESHRAELDASTIRSDAAQARMEARTAK